MVSIAARCQDFRSRIVNNQGQSAVPSLRWVSAFLALLLAGVALQHPARAAVGANAPQHPDAAGAATAPSVRVLYLIPTDRTFRTDYASAIAAALPDLQTWFAGQLGGRTFQLTGSLPQTCQLPHASAYYVEDSWNKVHSDVQACAPVTYASPTVVWVLYVDIVHGCNAPGRLGAGTAGLTMLPRQDMDGLIGAPYFDDCGNQWTLPPSRYVGGLGHEMGHAFGLPHPPGCDAGLNTCDYGALMWAGYAAYPNTYLRAAEKTALLNSPFFGSAQCQYAVSTSAVTVPASGGSVSFTVDTRSDCTWSAQTAAPFISTQSGGSGTGPGAGSFLVAPNTNAGSRAGTIEVAGSAFTVTQLGVGPTMTVDKSALTFGAITSGNGFSSVTPPQTVRLSQVGSGTVAWKVASSVPWLAVSPASGAGPAVLAISAHANGTLSPVQTGTITINATGAGAAIAPISVTLRTMTTGAAAQGSFDTPLDNASGVTGSLPVTGWAADDIGVSGVRIMRAPLAGESPSHVIAGVSLVFIGNAVLVDGARPDIVAQFPNAPRNTSAGWGYMMLTNFLPDLGNGTFVLYAVADDADGHSTILGSKRITCTNANIQTPFGTIDTPAQGGTVDGIMTNFGWVLVPGPARADPPGGGSVRVVVDGALVATVPAGWTSRADLSALFPAATFPGITNALGVATLDTTTLANGVHTIAWVVTDNFNRAAGIGSRYFTVANGVVAAAATSGISAHQSASAASVNAAGAISIRRGFDLDAPYIRYEPRHGVTTIHAEELDRVEIQLGGPTSRHAGYLRAAGRLADLPIGSALNAATGEFTWNPGVAFVGSYDFVFVASTPGGAARTREVRIVINPKGSGRIGPQVIVDGPANGSIVAPSFAISGWAADLDSQVDRGVDTVHVWAYPVSREGTREEPAFLGAATVGLARPDVRAVHGDRFEASGYHLSIDRLAPGTYDLAVFAYSTVRGGFAPASVVRVTVR